MDYLKIYEKFKEVDEVKEYIDDVNKLRDYYNSQQFSAMQEHIRNLTQKYVVETFMWNSANRDMPQTVEQSYINADCFLRKQGALIIIKKVKNYIEYLSKEEVEFIESVSK